MKEPIDILLVEDEAAHIALVTRLFESCNIATRVLYVEDGSEAMDYLYRRRKFSDPAQSPQPGLILLDLRLPKLGGMAVLKTIKADPMLRGIPVVILTTSNAEADKAEAFANHASSFMVKSDLFYEQTDRMMETFCKLMEDGVTNK